MGDEVVERLSDNEPRLIGRINNYGRLESRNRIASSVAGTRVKTDTSVALRNSVAKSEKWRDWPSDIIFVMYR
jgi:hypothetical protein